MTKHCPNCDRDLPFSAFGACKNKKSGLQSWCKECKSENSKQRLLREDVKEANRKKSAQARKLNPEKIKETARKHREKVKNDPEKIAERNRQKLERHYLQEYGLTIQQVEDKKAAQGYKCAICGISFADTKNAHVDHNHETGQVRDILCSSCNMGIGKFKESIPSLEKAIAYLLKHSAA